MFTVLGIGENSSTHADGLYRHTASGASIPHLETAVNSDLENLRKWLIANRLTLNVHRIDFNILSEKLYRMGVHPVWILINWIANFLTDRKQRTRIDNHYHLDTVFRMTR